MPRASVFDRPALEGVRRAARLDPAAINQLRGDLLRRFVPDDAALSRFSAASHVEVHCLELVERHDSAVDGATKLLLRTASGHSIETVLLRVASGRTAVCVSSQAGCAAACAFCATGWLSTVRNLEAREILDQLLIAGQLANVEGRRLRNVVFMGMGEPFHNEAQVFAALEECTARDGFHVSAAKIVVSTVGVADAMLRCAERFPAVRQALSLHSVRQDVREQLVPLAHKYPLDTLRATVRTINDRTQSPVMLEYLLLAELNDSAEDAQALIDWSAGLNVHVNLIPYNPIVEAPELQGSEPAVREAFARQLKSAGLPTTIRYSLGRDIQAACGQLARRSPSRPV